MEIFGYGVIYKKVLFFSDFLIQTPKKVLGSCTHILMPPTFPIASLNRFTPEYSGVPQKLTWCQQFGLQVRPKWGNADFWPLKKVVLGIFLD